MKITEQQIVTIDENNRKARAILANMEAIKEFDPDIKMDSSALVDAALDYLNANNQIFKERL